MILCSLQGIGIFIVADHGFDLGIWNASVRNAVNDRLKIGSASGHQHYQL